MSGGENRPSFFDSVLYGIVTSFVAAPLFLIAMWLGLPASDEAAREGFFGALLDPFVLTVMIPVALVAGLLAGSITHLATSGRRYRNAVFTVAGSVLCWIAVATAISPRAALLGVFPVFLLAIIVIRFAPWTRLPERT